MADYHHGEDTDPGSDQMPLMSGHDGGGGRGGPLLSGRPAPGVGPRRSCQRCMSDVLRPCVAEAVGVTLFVFLGSLSGLSISGLTVGLTHGLTIAVLIIAFGRLSGGHFNPCVTLGVLLGGGLSPLASGCYVLAQLCGSMAGSALTMLVLSGDAYREISGGVPGLGLGVSVGQGLVCEATLTFLLVSMVLMSAVDADDNMLAPLAIGLSITVDILAAGSISGAVMNPARAFGPSVLWSTVEGSGAWAHHYVYWAGPVIGTLLAALFYRFVFGSSHKRFLCRGSR